MVFAGTLPEGSTPISEVQLFLALALISALIEPRTATFTSLLMETDPPTSVVPDCLEVNLKSMGLFDVFSTKVWYLTDMVFFLFFVILKNQPGLHWSP